MKIIHLCRYLLKTILTRRLCLVSQSNLMAQLLLTAFFVAYIFLKNILSHRYMKPEEVHFNGHFYFYSIPSFLETDAHL